jgi:hypothetical protein
MPPRAIFVSLSDSDDDITDHVENVLGGDMDQIRERVRVTFRGTQPTLAGLPTSRDEAQVTRDAVRRALEEHDRLLEQIESLTIVQ